MDHGTEDRQTVVNLTYFDDDGGGEPSYLEYLGLVVECVPALFGEWKLVALTISCLMA